jgi:hypothetical protein
MTNKELRCLGIALDALLRNKLYEDASRIARAMAEEPVDQTEKKEDSKAAD